MSNFTFFPQCFPCIFKSFNCHISVVVCSFFEFGAVSQNAVLGNGSKGYLLLNYLSLTEEETEEEEEEEEEEVFAVFDFISVISQRQLVLSMSSQDSSIGKGFAKDRRTLPTQFF